MLSDALLFSQQNLLSFLCVYWAGGIFFTFQFFMDDCLQRLIDRIDSGEDFKSLIPSDHISKLIRFRLEMQAPYISKWPQALSIQVLSSAANRLVKALTCILKSEPRKISVINFFCRHNHWMFRQVLSRGQCL